MLKSAFHCNMGKIDKKLLVKMRLSTHYKLSLAPNYHRTTDNDGLLEYYFAGDRISTSDQVLLVADALQPHAAP